MKSRARELPRARLFAFTLAAGLLVACGRNDPNVRPAAGTEVRISAEPGLMGEQSVPPEFEFTPATVTIENRGNHALRIRYDDFELTNADGDGAAAVPVYQIFTDPVALQPIFRHERFAVAPSYGPYFPDLPAWPDPLAGTALGYAALDPSPWLEFYADSLLVAEALPEGVLLPGGSVSGVLWFEAMEDGDAPLRLKADLVDAESGNQFGEIRVPVAAPTDSHRGAGGHDS